MDTVIARTILNRSQHRETEARGLSHLFFLLTAAWCGLVACTFLAFEPEHRSIVLLVLASTFVYVLFYIIVRFVLKRSPLKEIAFAFISLVLLYTLYPAVKILYFEIVHSVGFSHYKIVGITVTSSKAARQLWRHVVLIVGVASGYLFLEFLQGKRPPRQTLELRINSWLVWVALAIVVLSATIPLLLSGTVFTYHENYTRYDHLSDWARRFVYVCLSIKHGGYYILLTLLFYDFRRRRAFLALFVLAASLFELITSLGSRIFTFSFLTAAVCLYELKVGRISFRRVFALVFLAVLLFTGVERIRVQYSSPGSVKLYRNSELGSVFRTGFHIYNDRTNLPDRPWQMGFYEVLSIVPFVDSTTYHPMYWYARRYFPNAIVPPATVGIVAMSGLWGREIGLFFTGFLGGCLFSGVARLFLQGRERWWATILYVYLYASSIFALKYSLLYPMVPLVQRLVPALLFYSPFILLGVRRGRAKGPSSAPRVKEAAVQG